MHLWGCDQTNWRRNSAIYWARRAPFKGVQREPIFRFPDAPSVSRSARTGLHNRSRGAGSKRGTFGVGQPGRAHSYPSTSCSQDSRWPQLKKARMRGTRAEFSVGGVAASPMSATLLRRDAPCALLPPPWHHVFRWVTNHIESGGITLPPVLQS